MGKNRNNQKKQKKNTDSPQVEKGTEVVPEAEKAPIDASKIESSKVLDRKRLILSILIYNQSKLNLNCMQSSNLKQSFSTKE